MTKAEEFIKGFYATKEPQKKIDYRNLSKSEINDIISRVDSVIVKDEAIDPTVGYDDFELDCAMLCDPSYTKIKLFGIVGRLTKEIKELKKKLYTPKFSNIAEGTEDNKDIDFDFCYPLTVIKDRYDGTYSGGKFLAFNDNSVPAAVYGDDVICAGFWSKTGHSYMVGKGNTPNEAIADLIKQKCETNLKIWCKGV